MAPFFANQSCDPFTERSAQCVLGNYIQYAVNVSAAADVSAGIKFANDRSIRLVIRNTGHDYNGKSTGAGALGLWMHNLKNIEFKDWDDETYKGKAIKMAAGVIGQEAYKAADGQVLQVVSGECPSVGMLLKNDALVWTEFLVYAKELPQELQVAILKVAGTPP